MAICPRLLLVLCLAMVVLRSDPAGASAAFASPTIPKTTISNGVLEAVILLPDSKTGYYRGPRFDWSGLIARVKYQGHTYFGEWRTPHNPEGNDDVVGPAEEFGMGGPGTPGPLGYEEASPGGAFIKIGVGLLEKTAEPGYDYGQNYRIVKPGEWEIDSGKTWVEFHQELKDASGWGYSYTKRVSLVSDRPELIVAHTLRNTGSKPIVTTQYCHNFTIIDEDPIGPHYAVRFPFQVKAESGLGKLAEVHADTISFPKTLTEGEEVDAELGGFSDAVGDNGAIIENLKTGAGVRIRGSKPIVRLHIYAVGTAVCPEPFVDLRLCPGEQTQWENSYTFYQVGAPGE